MPDYPFMQVDAFTEQPLGGNPCAVVFAADDLDEALMLAIAREMNLSETAFIRASSVADFGARYFTPAEEIPLAGHPTVAVVHALIENGRLALTGEHTRITLELKAGVIPVDVIQSNATRRIVMSQLKPRFLAIYAADQAARAFGLNANDFLPNAPIQTVSTGTPQLMLPVRDLSVLRKIELNPAEFRRLREMGDFFSAHLFCLGGITPNGDTFARHFALPPDVIEDPFTGSATGGMAAYLWRYGLIPSPSFTAEQGHWLERPGSASVEVVGLPEDIQTVKVGGSAVTVLRGALTI